MACYQNDNVYTNTFTPREYQVELLEAAKIKNIVICSSTSSAKTFITVKLLKEFSSEMRSCDGKRALFLLDQQNIPIMKSHVELLTDLNVLNVGKKHDIDNEEIWEDSLKTNHVVMCTAEVCTNLQCIGLCDLTRFTMIAIDDCLFGKRQDLLKDIMTKYCEINNNKPRILGLATNLLGPHLQSERLESEFQRLEKLLSSHVDTSSEIVTLLRLSCRPRERLVECSRSNSSDLVATLTDIVNRAKNFLLDHRYDPSEIYEDEFLEELKQIPDPKEKPLEILRNFMCILNDLGPWSADRAAVTLLNKIEKLKVKVPYERQFLLLCTVSTVLVSIRAICSHVFDELPDHEKILNYSSEKVLRFLEVLKQFKPPGEKPPPVEKPVEQPVENNSQKGRGKTGKPPKRTYMHRTNSEDTPCVLVFTNNIYTAKTLFGLLYALSQSDNDFWWISVLYSVEKLADPINEPKEAEQEHKRQEDVLRKYRSHECNIMISTSVLENDCDLPKCNLVIRFDLPQSFLSYIQCKARARASEPHFIIFVNEDEMPGFVEKLAEYNEVENILLRRCRALEPCKSEELYADSFQCEPYQPLPEPGSPSVSLNNSIALVNRYCAKLPSDTFTRLTPIWYEEPRDQGFVCSIRLPINSPVKQVVVSPVMENYLLARRAAAFMVCMLLHKSGELDDNLQPIGKENFRANEEDWNSFPLEEADEKLTHEDSEPRPGTTKRRQYYYKRIADSLLECHPNLDEKVYFYEIVMILTCPLPEEQNTRGRKIYPPEESIQGFGILTKKEIPQISTFPIFTRSGEVSVNLRLCSEEIVLNETNIMKIREFVNYTFTSVLRLKKYLMLFDPVASKNAYLIVPTKRDENRQTNIDWKFIDLIYENLKYQPKLVPEEERQNYKFNPEKYKDAVVMPWYRNQDQPQYFYVAEICSNLNPESSFPGSEYATFEEYYFRKYGINIQNTEQYLLDVDHTSARLNFLTPRYVNRKGVALPTSSEETKKAKRENLEQKQILVPELCAIHPFPASLWRKAVCLPCILYRINALLLADQIRKTVSIEIGLGRTTIDKEFEWPALNFGWSLSDVLRKYKEEATAPTSVNELPPTEVVKIQELTESDLNKMEEETENDSKKETEEIKESSEESQSETVAKGKDWIEIGIWSNEMAGGEGASGKTVVRYGSPTSWLNQNAYDDDFSSSESIGTDDSESEFGGLRIEFTGDNVAEAVDDDCVSNDSFNLVDTVDTWTVTDISDTTEKLKTEFYAACAKNKEHILSSEILVRKDQPFQRHTDSMKNTSSSYLNRKELSRELFDVQVKDSNFELSNAGYVNEYYKFDKLSFSFDYQPNLSEHPGPSPSILLQALTMSNANDGINLERLETIGDSFLKYAITNYVYSKYENVHEGKLSHLRSKQVSNLNLYRLGKKKNLGEYMIATKFDPHDNWLPPCFYVPKQLEEAMMDAQYPMNCWTSADIEAAQDMTLDEICTMVRERTETSVLTSVIPYNLVTQHSIPDKSIADCVEALIGAYLIECGPRGALLFMAWLGIRVLPKLENGGYGEIELPKSPLIIFVDNPEAELERLLDGYDSFEKRIGYKFKDRSYLLQALTHASYFPNKLTDCYQRLEFLGDAVLDYLITRHLYEDHRMHSPGALTDLRSALVNNTIFASLAVRNGFHHYFRHLSPGLNEVIEKFIRLQEESGHTIVDELYLVAENECEEVEDVEVPKALGDVFESVAGAIFLDSGMSLDTVWSVYYAMMQNEIEQFSNKVPKSPIRELLELEPETAKFGKPEKLTDGRRVRVTVEVFGKGVFKGIGRNYRIAKCTAAKCALRQLKRKSLMKLNN